MKVYGTVFRPDGKSPAANILLYLYHTKPQGIFPTRGYEQGWAKRHGYLRGWVKTGKDGTSAFRPAQPIRTPEHLHITRKEPGKIHYYLAEPLLNNTAQHPQRGGSGALLLVKRDIVLGKNIPTMNNLRALKKYCNSVASNLFFP